MDKYIGAKIIRAEKMDECTFLSKFKGQDVSNRETQPGYHVKYPDNYDSWSPEHVFESAYRLFTDGVNFLICDGEPETASDKGDATFEDKEI